MSMQAQPNVPCELDAALEYARMGIPVFPANPLDKKPLTAHGFKDATVDETQVREWWQRWPNAMIAACTGPASGLWVLDVDKNPVRGIDGARTLAKLIAQYGAISKTMTSITPRGGRHLMFAWPSGIEIRNSTGKLGDGIDVRGEGGYVCLPPSRRADGVVYQWDADSPSQACPAPGWLIELVRAENRAAKRDKTWALKALQQECDAVANAKPGVRNARLNQAAFNLAQIVAGGKLDEQEVRKRLLEAAEKCGLVNDDGEAAVKATIDSGFQAGSSQPRTRPQPGPQPQSGIQTPSAAQSQPGAQPGAQPQPGAQAATRPTIRLVPGELPRIVDEAEGALIAGGGFNFYQRGGMIVRPVVSKLRAAHNRTTFGWRLISTVSIYMIEALTRAAEFERWDARASKFVPRDCPAQIADALLAREGHWRLPNLAGVVNTPFLRSDGSLCEQPGYDAASELLFEPNGQAFPSIPSNPTKEEAEGALRYVEWLIRAFPFVEDVDHSVALSAIFTTFDRRAMATAPLHAFTAPDAGTGKSLLVDIASLVATGQLAPVISQEGGEGELQKRLAAALLSGDSIISVDNCDEDLKSSFLSQVLTQERINIRLLGYSRQVETPNNASFFATGNNLVITGDLDRRTLLCTMNANCERPELRSFELNVVQTIHADRGRLVAAVLTVLRAWHVAGMPKQAKPYGSFEDWSRRIRDLLIWLGRDDPINSTIRIRESDPSRTDLRATLEAWRMAFGLSAPKTVQQVINAGLVNSDLQSALTKIAGASNGVFVSNEKLGRWLRKVEGKIANKLKFVNVGSRHGYQLWTVQIAQ